ncbi:hypothetical protein Afil01_65820 [Actinorhabdospora filicis]|uniref:Deferrochelatase n=1 Tax=Actinorhabdospora filicis TaxID=1785913 RepID=A0A9W6SRV3_9ACTN|nr:iron uptake transporter deferrochelatase/peroxidase subunit [Actinorhabdospora filicis]GLZ81775.1 hypothetical protein Afil01_65820 [Actinorhabdospora filicis]
MGESNISRRTMLGLVGGAGVAVGVAGTSLALGPSGVAQAADVSAPISFYGTHQAGITTPAQDRLHFASFDLITKSRDDLIALLRAWSAAAAQMTAGHPAGATGAVDGHPAAPPDDTGEALDLPPGGLTLTIGFGPSMFDGRFGLADRKPAALAELPHFVGDALRPEISDGDLCVQACAYDPQVAVHAIRNLARIGFGKVSVRWSQLGFGRTSATTRDQVTPRNMMGFKDGTNNIKAEDTQLLDEHVWVPQGDGPAWMTGGSYMVTRRIRMTIETWDRTSLAEQEGVIGRTKKAGAPMHATGEFDELDFEAKGPDGKPATPMDAHVRLAHHTQAKGARILRRGYNFADGSDGLGRLDAGLFFIAYQRDPRTGFVPIQQNLGGDALNEYIRHVGSGLFACPPGVAGPGGFWGEGLFA